MKRILSFLLAAAMTFSLAACSQGETSEISAPSDSGPYETETDAGISAEEVRLEGPGAGTKGPENGEGSGTGDILVEYFSWADNAVLAEDVDAVSSPSVVPPGNVQQLAGWV